MNCKSLYITNFARNGDNESPHQLQFKDKFQHFHHIVLQKTVHNGHFKEKSLTLYFRSHACEKNDSLFTHFSPLLTSDDHSFSAYAHGSQSHCIYYLSTTINVKFGITVQVLFHIIINVKATG